MKILELPEIREIYRTRAALFEFVASWATADVLHRVSTSCVARSTSWRTRSSSPIVEQKARVVAHTCQLDADELTAYLEREGVKLAEYEQWRIALDEGRARLSINK